jgi:hypothetical protein
MAKESNDEGRAKQVAVGAVIMFVIFGSVISLISLWRCIPGWIGECIGMFAGLISSPFILEGFFVIMGFFLVLFLNSWRRKMRGGDFVEFDASEFDQKQPVDRK